MTDKIKTRKKLKKELVKEPTNNTGSTWVPDYDYRPDGTRIDLNNPSRS